MDDLISRNDLVAWIRNLEITNMSRVADGLKPKGLDTDGMLHMVLKMPTVDAVEVVRCKDCIHWYEPEEVCLKIYSDGAVSQYAWQNRNPDDFCSYGERKEKGE